MTPGPGALAIGGLAYLLGSVPTSFLVGRLVFGIDLRRHGSGNVGATNALRVLGTKAGVAVLAGDMAKGTVAVLLAAHLSALWGLGSPELWPILGGAAAVVGHVFTVWLRFQGGKGVATAAGVFLALAPRSLGICLLVFILTVALTRYVSLGSILAALLIGPLTRWETGRWDSPVTLLALAAGLLVVVRHRSNLARLLSGTESKFSSSSSSSPSSPSPSSSPPESGAP